MYSRECDNNDCKLYDINSIEDENDFFEEYEMELPCVNCPIYRNSEQVVDMFRSPNPGMPPGPPPSFIPNQQQQQSFGGPTTKAIDQGAIRVCRYRFTYIWQRNGNAYWAYLTYVGRRSIAGFRWVRSRWVYFGLDLRQISSFFCA